MPLRTRPAAWDMRAFLPIPISPDAVHMHGPYNRCSGLAAEGQPVGVRAGMAGAHRERRPCRMGPACAGRLHSGIHAFRGKRCRGRRRKGMEDAGSALCGGGALLRLLADEEHSWRDI